MWVPNNTKFLGAYELLSGTLIQLIVCSLSTKKKINL